MALLQPARGDIASLFELTDPGSEHEGLESYLRRTLEVCVDWFQATGATLFLKSEVSGEFLLVARAGADARAPMEASVVEGEGIAGVALQSGEPMLVRDPREHALLEGQVKNRKQEIGSSLIVPLHTQHLGKLGVLCLSRRQGEPEFSRHDLATARSVASQVALAVANARLYARARAALVIERELAEAKRLAEIGQMTAAIAHEIRNPLTGMMGAAQMVSDLGGEAAEFGKIMEEEIVKLDRLCGDFLEFARPFSLNLVPSNLAAIVRGVVEAHRTEFAKDGLELAFESSHDEPMILLDALRIEQVVRNLLRNAKQASEPGMRITVRVNRRTIEVKDEGKGMNQDEVAGLFVPFFTKTHGGTGLGMSVVKKIVDAHGGRIDAESSPGRGTTIRIRLCAPEDQ